MRSPAPHVAVSLHDPHASPPTTCAVVIVGAGLAGLELARELERRGARDVVVLEAGPAHDPRHINVAHSPDSALRAWLAPETDAHFNRRWTSATPPHYAAGSGLRQRLGGRSLYWHGVVLPIEPWALREPWWPAQVIADLREAWEGGPGLYDRVQRQLQDWTGRRPPPSPDLVLEGYALCPTPRAVRRPAAQPDRWFAYSPLDDWRDPETGVVSRAPVGVHLFPGVEVVQVVVRGGTARGVVVRSVGTDERREIAAAAVVLAGGTLENSRLGLQALVEARALPAPRLPGLADHIVQGVIARFARPQANRLTAVAPPGSYFAPCAEARSNLFLDVQARADGDVLVDLQLSGEQLPSSESFVACEPSPRFPWAVTVCTATTGEDRALLARQRQILRRVWGAIAKAADGGDGELEFAEYDAPERTYSLVLGDLEAGVPSTWSSCLGSEDHEGGTLPLGGVLDGGHEFASIPGLFAAGPSTFPRLGAANPGLTIIALARRLGALLHRRAFVGP